MTLNLSTSTKYFMAAIFFAIWSCFYLPTCSSESNIDITTSARAFTPGTINAVYTDTPKTKYVYVITITPDVWDHSIDTMYRIMNEFGVDMTVTQSRQYQQMFGRQLIRLASLLRVDSIVSKPKK